MNKDEVRNFEFNSESIELANKSVSKYPKGREKSAILDLLNIAQNQNNGWLSQSAIEYVANFLSIPAIRVLEVASFYSMFNLKPVGKYLVQICRTTPCWLRGSDQIREVFERNLQIKVNETTKDKLFSLKEVECLGACVNAPVVQINNDFYEDLDEKKVENILNQISTMNSDLVDNSLSDKEG